MRQYGNFRGGNLPPSNLFLSGPTATADLFGPTFSQVPGLTAVGFTFLGDPGVFVEIRPIFCGKVQFSELRFFGNFLDQKKWLKRNIQFFFFSEGWFYLRSFVFLWGWKMDTEDLQFSTCCTGVLLGEPTLLLGNGWVGPITLSTCAAELFLNTICQTGTTAIYILVEYVSKRVECEEISPDVRAMQL